MASVNHLIVRDFGGCRVIEVEYGPNTIGLFALQVLLKLGLVGISKRLWVFLRCTFRFLFCPLLVHLLV
jgi:hypothetical protein